MRRRITSILLALGLISGLVFAAAPAYASTSPDIVDNLCAGANLQVGTNCNTGGSNGATQQIDKVIKLIINTLSLVVGIVAVVMIIIGGMRYITSGGNDTGVTGAKNTILYAIIGLIIVAMAQVIIRFVLNKLNSA